MQLKRVPQLKKTKAAAKVLAQACHARAWNAGWWHNPKTKKRRRANVVQKLMLIGSEVFEAFEGVRRGLMDDKLPHRTMLEVELADTVIRCFDTAEGLGLDLAGAITEKMAYNAKRADHKLANRKKKGGKQF